MALPNHPTTLRVQPLPAHLPFLLRPTAHLCAANFSLRPCLLDLTHLWPVLLLGASRGGSVQNEDGGFAFSQVSTQANFPFVSFPFRDALFVLHTSFYKLQRPRQAL